MAKKQKRQLLELMHLSRKPRIEPTDVVQAPVAVAVVLVDSAVALVAAAWADSAAVPVAADAAAEVEPSKTR